ncbi:hypothetical protein FRX31_020739 [Thalictrum thalictroides]|uniref:Transmembrane protein n=1 Tax=Thalictrum thalictroides TaxID=46969 RepID=A0A7J6VZ91_THATH|nr:hypothetical protein FRX31_020739 [Thalictrum thalictroides]
MSLNSTTGEDHYWDDSVGVPLPELSSCNINVKVIILRERVGGQNFSGSQLNMEEGVLPSLSAIYDGLQDERCPTLRPIKRANMRRSIVIALATGIGSVLAATVVFYMWRSKRSPTRSVIFWKGSKKSQSLVEEFLQNYGSLAPKRYSYSDIK